MDALSGYGSSGDEAATSAPATTPASAPAPAKPAASPAKPALSKRKREDALPSVDAALGAVDSGGGGGGARKRVKLAEGSKASDGGGGGGARAVAQGRMVPPHLRSGVQNVVTEDLEKINSSATWRRMQRGSGGGGGGRDKAAADGAETVTVRALLESMAVPDDTGEGGVVCANSTDSIADVWELLFGNHIMSVPVRVADSHDKYLGIIDVLDLLMFVLREFSDGREVASVKTMSELLETSWLARAELKRHVRAHDESLQSHDASEAVQPLSFLHKLKQGSTLKDAALLLGSSGCHRAAVVDADGAIKDYLTQSSLIVCLAIHAARLSDPIFETSIDELGLAKKTVEAVKESETAIEAFKKMNALSLSGLPIVDDAGNLVGNISSSDLKGIGEHVESFHRLGDPVLDYLTYLRVKQPKSLYPSINVKPHEKLMGVIKKIAAARIHRIYVTAKDSSQLEGVVTLTDILRVLAPLLKD